VEMIFNYIQLEKKNSNRLIAIAYRPYTLKIETWYKIAKRAIPVYLARLPTLIASHSNRRHTKSGM
jgi:hypothetical protein